MQILTRSLTVAAIAFAPLPAFAQTTSLFTSPDLPYEYGALELAISAETMELHHGKHHQT